MKSRWFRRALGLFAGLIVSLGVLIVYLRVFAGDVRQRLPSPDGRTVAEVVTLNFAAATDVPNTAVELRVKRNPFKHAVFGGLDYGVKVTVSWIDAKNLLVKCEDCTKLNYGNLKEDRWHDIRIHYDLDDGVMPQSRPDDVRRRE